MIYKRETFFEERSDDEKFPLREIDQITSLDGTQKRFVGHVNLGIQTPVGVSTMPVSFEIKADSIQEAFGKFAQCAESELEAARNELQQELQELRRRSQSRIITPGDLPPADLTKFKP